MSSPRFFLVSYFFVNGSRYGNGFMCIEIKDGIFRAARVIKIAQKHSEATQPPSIMGVFELTEQEYREANNGDG